jgi:hypothetical protein
VGVRGGASAAQRQGFPVRRAAGVASLALAVLAVAANPAGAAGSEPTHLRWSSPHSIQAGVAAVFSSIDTCPAVRPDGSPIQGTRMVGLFVELPKGGGFGTTFPVADDGSWDVTWVPDIGAGAPIPHGRSVVSAECLDVTFTGISLAKYQQHTIKVST